MCGVILPDGGSEQNGSVFSGDNSYLCGLAQQATRTVNTMANCIVNTIANCIVSTMANCMSNIIVSCIVNIIGNCIVST